MYKDLVKGNNFKKWKRNTVGNGKKKRVKSNLEERNEYNLVLDYK